MDASAAAAAAAAGDQQGEERQEEEEEEEVEEEVQEEAGSGQAKRRRLHPNSKENLLPNACGATKDDGSICGYPLASRLVAGAFGVYVAGGAHRLAGHSPQLHCS